MRIHLFAPELACIDHGVNVRARRQKREVDIAPPRKRGGGWRGTERRRQGRFEPLPTEMVEEEVDSSCGAKLAVRGWLGGSPRWIDRNEMIASQVRRVTDAPEEMPHMRPSSEASSRAVAHASSSDTCITWPRKRKGHWWPSAKGALRGSKRGGGRLTLASGARVETCLATMSSASHAPILGIHYE